MTSSTLSPKCFTCGRRPVLVVDGMKYFCSERCRTAYLVDFLGQSAADAEKTPPTNLEDPSLNSRITEKDRWFLAAYCKIIWDKPPRSYPVANPDPYIEPFPNEP
jgi:endogenous inhibitor of DNA gyrase (YacG/DUF329 family)